MRDMNRVEARKKLKEGIRKMFAARVALNKAFPKKPFTPDGRMVGDIGEAIAEIYYRVKIDDKINKHWDGVRGSRKVQVKATQKNAIYLARPPHEGGLFVFKIHQTGEWDLIYNGSIMKVWKSLNKKRQRSIKLEMIPLHALGWKEKQKVVVRRVSGGLTIRDWKK